MNNLTIEAVDNHVVGCKLTCSYISRGRHCQNSFDLIDDTETIDDKVESQNNSNF